MEPAQLVIPPDVFEIILGHLRTPFRSVDLGAERAQRADLCAAALVHRSYTSAARRVLSEAITLQSAAQATAVNVAIERGHVLLPLVRVITINPTFDSEAWRSERRAAAYQSGAGTPEDEDEVFSAGIWAHSHAIWDTVKAAGDLAWRCRNLVAVRARDTRGRTDMRAATSWPPVELVVFDNDAEDYTHSVCEALDRQGAEFSGLTFLHAEHPYTSDPDGILSGMSTDALDRLVRLQLGSREQPLDLLDQPILDRPARHLRELVLYLDEWLNSVHMAFGFDAVPLPSLQTLTMGASCITVGSDRIAHLPPALVRLNIDVDVFKDDCRGDSLKGQLVDRVNFLCTLPSEIGRHLDGMFMAHIMG